MQSLFIPRSKPNVGQSYEISNTRYRLFVQSKYEGEKLPPTKGALKKHLLRALFQLLIWSSAHLAIIPDHEPREFGWDLQGNDYVAQTTDDLIAPKAVVELVSCNCKGNCSSRRCSCQRINYLARTIVVVQ